MKDETNTSETTNTIYSQLRREFGSIHEPMEFRTVAKYIEINKSSLKAAHGLFLEHASATNWNVVIYYMVLYQYWSQKKVMADV